MKVFVRHFFVLSLLLSQSYTAYAFTQIGDLEVTGEIKADTITNRDGTTNYITDAPADNKEYVRVNHAWQEATSSGGGGTWGSITGTLSDQTDLQSALDNKANAIDLTGLGEVTENGKTGWRLKTVDPANYGDIGSHAIDLSHHLVAGDNGATGDFSVAIGDGTSASGWGSVAIGANVHAPNDNQVCIGELNVGTATDTIFELGHGAPPNHANAMEIYDDGTATLPQALSYEVDNRGSQAIATKGYVDNAISGVTGDITGVSAGTGLSGGGSSGDVTLSVDTTSTQSRVTGTCVGQVMVGIAEDGTVTCEADDTGSGSTNLSTTVTGTVVTVESDTGTNATIPAATGTEAGVLTATDKSKLDGIEAGATANSSDATLLDRANHTGTQTASTISDFDTEVTNNAAVAANTAKISYPGDELTADELAAVNGAATPSASNVFATMADVGSGSGDVTKVGSPVDNQVGVWTGDGTIEGTTGLTYDGSTLSVTGDISLTGYILNRWVDLNGDLNNLTFNGSTDPLVDASATDGNHVLPASAVISSLAGKEDSLGNPSVDGYVLSSTAAGVRSWVAQSGGALHFDDLLDVDSASALDGQVVKYNSTTSSWEPANDDTAAGAGYVSTPPTYSDEDCTPGQYALTATTGYVCVANNDWNTFALTDWNNPQPVTYSLTVDMVDGNGTDYFTYNSTNYTTDQTFSGLTADSSFTVTADTGRTASCTGTGLTDNGSGSYTAATSTQNVTATCTYAEVSTGADYQWNLDDNAATQTVAEVGGSDGTTYAVNTDTLHSTSCLEGTGCFDYSTVTSGYEYVEATPDLSQAEDDTYTIQLSYNIPVQTINYYTRLVETNVEDFIRISLNASNTDINLYFRGNSIGMASVNDIATGAWQVLRFVFDNGSVYVYQGADEASLSLVDTLTGTFGTGVSAGNNFIRVYGTAQDDRCLSYIDGVADQVKIWNDAITP